MWGLGKGLVAAVLLLAGDRGALQTASIAVALLVSVIMLMMTCGVVKSLSEDSSAVVVELAGSSDPGDCGITAVTSA